MAFNSRAWLWATYAKAKYRDGKRAVVAATTTCELDGWKIAAHLGTPSTAYAGGGGFDEAVECLEKAAKLHIDAEDKKKGEDRLKIWNVADVGIYREVPGGDFVGWYEAWLDQ